MHIRHRRTQSDLWQELFGTLEKVHLLKHSYYLAVMDSAVALTLLVLFQHLSLALFLCLKAIAASQIITGLCCSAHYPSLVFSA